MMEKGTDLIKSFEQRPRVLIPTGMGFNSYEELGYCFNLSGADVDFIHTLQLIENPDIMDQYNGFGDPGGFTGGDHLGAGQFIANLFRKNPKAVGKLEEKLNDETFPMIFVCNSAQILSKLGLYPVQIGTVQNDVGKHMTGHWDISIDPNCKSVWLDELRKTSEPIYAHISHGEGRFYLTEEGIRTAHEKGMVALRYAKGAMYDYFKPARGDAINPNGSTDDIAGLAWKNNLALFPHFERLHRNFQRPDRYDAKKRGLDLKAHYEPTVALFKGAVDYMKKQMR